jgi:hypothetical protein
MPLQPSPARKRALAVLILLGALPLRAAEGPPESLALVQKMVEAHGGIERWASAPTVSFVDELRFVHAPTGRISRVTVEQGSRRAYLDFPGHDAQVAWDGERAWSVHWKEPVPPRFLALLNYYFLDLPWLALDPGVRLGRPGTGRILDHPEEYQTVKMTFGPGVGDTPDDYYVLYIDPQSHRLRACEYIVTYRSILPEGVASSEPHLLVYDRYTAVEGLVVPSHYTIYEHGEVYASCEVREWSFSRPFATSRMTMPEEAVIDTSTP